MNKSILKHEIRSMKWITLVVVIASLFAVLMFDMSLNMQYEDIIIRGSYGNKFIIKDALDESMILITLLFIAISIIQIFMQFKSEKGQEIARFLKSLPIKGDEFVTIKLLIGIVNITIGFLIILIGFIFVRSSNMFWINDIKNLSHSVAIFNELNSIKFIFMNLLLIYLISITFYTFLFMIQYTSGNVAFGIVTGFLIWLAPLFIAISSVYFLEQLNIISTNASYSNTIAMSIMNNSEKLLPWIYPLDKEYILLFNYLDIGDVLGVSIIRKIELKYIICIVMSLINISISYVFAKKSRVENEDRLILFKSTGKIFKFGVSVCSGLLVFIILSKLIYMKLNNILLVLLVIIAGAIGYLISNKITKVGLR